MTKKKRNLFSALAAAVFLTLAAGSSGVNKIHCGAFSRMPNGESTDRQNYVELHDGSKVYGKSIKWKTGLLVKDQIKIDDIAHHIKETRGYFSNGIYYGRLGNSYAQRLVHGKLNLYFTEDWVSTTDSRGRMTQRLTCRHYVQVGDNGPMKAIGDQSDIKEYVSSCPKAFEMVDKKDREIRRAIRKNRNYLNEVFITYNQGCK